MAKNTLIEKYKNVEKKLEGEKSKEISTFMTMNKILETKTLTLSRITKYRAEYENENTAKLSKTVPALMINMIEFLNKLDVTIKDETLNVEKIKHEVIEVSNRIKLVDMKIRAFKMKIEAMERQYKLSLENNESRTSDEAAIISKLRHTT